METLFAALFVGYASYAFNKKCVTLSLPSLIEGGLDATHAGLISSSQQFALAISKFAAGALSDRVDAELLFWTGLLTSGLTAVLFSGSGSVPVLAGLWFANGIAQGCGWPSIAKILRQRASPSQFGTWWSILFSANNFSGSLSPFLLSYITIHYGWRWSVFIAGCSSVILSALFILLIFLPKTRSKRPSVASTQKSPGKKPSEMGPESIYDLLSDPLVWLVSFCYMAVLCAKGTVVDWGQMYLIQERKQTQFAASAFTSFVETGGFFGKIAAGYLTDWVIKRNKKTLVTAVESNSGARLKVALCFAMVNLVCLHAFRVSFAMTSSVTLLAALGFIMGATMFGPLTIFGIVASESAPPHLSGVAYAIASSAGNVGATISGLPFSYVAKWYNWSSLFVVLEIITFIVVVALYFFRNLTPFVMKRKIS